MKRNLIVLLTILLAFVACNRPKTIPDDTLEAILREVYVTNAIAQGRYYPMNPDTLEVYRPIFERYGYTPQDMLHTINELSKRKSVRFTDILTGTIARIERESKRYDSLVALRDTIDSRIERRYREVFYTDTLYHLTRWKDAKDFEIDVPIRTGRYELGFAYRVDSVDLNPYLQYYQYMLDTAKERSNTLTRSLSQRGSWQHIDLSFTVNNPAIRTLMILPTRITSTREYKTDVMFDSLRIVRYPLPEEAKERFIREITLHDSLIPKPLRYFYYDEPVEKDFVTLRPDTTRVEAGRDSVVRSDGPAL